MLELSVVVPARNAERLIDDCLRSIVRSQPREIIVVDGESSDRTVQIARRYGAKVLSDWGQGLPAARLIGARAALAPWVALIDADVVVGEGDLARLLDEVRRDGYTALQAGLRSVSADGYWGQALVHHHRTGRSKGWFGVVATIFDREALLQHGFDAKLLLALPLAAGMRGAVLGLLRGQPRWLPYYACFVVFNYSGLLREVAERGRGGRTRFSGGRA